MLQKMRMLFALFITLPLILSLSLEPGYAETINIEKEIEEILNKVDVFKSKTEGEKDKILRELDSSILDLNKEIKKYISEKKEYSNDKDLVLMEKMLELNLYIKNKVCNQEDKNCINEKKRLINNLLDVVGDNYGECPVIIEHLDKITSDININFSLLTLLIVSVADNSDFIKRSKAEIIVNIIYCLSDNFQVINAKYGEPKPASFFKENLAESLFRAYLKLRSIPVEKENSKSNKLSFETREDVYEEILGILKEIKDSKKDKTLIIIISCLATITILIGGFLLYRFIRRKNFNPIETTKDLVASENKVSK